MYALIKDGVVKETTTASVDYVRQISDQYDSVIACGFDIQVGYLWSAVGGFVAPSSDSLKTIETASPDSAVDEAVQEVAEEVNADPALTQNLDGSEVTPEGDGTESTEETGIESTEGKTVKPPATE